MTTNTEVEAIRSSEARRSLQVGRISHHYGQAAFLGLMAVLLAVLGVGLSFVLGSLSYLVYLAAIAIAVLALREMRYGKVSYEQLKAACE